MRVLKSDRRGGGAARLFVGGEEADLAARARRDRDNAVWHQLDAVRIACRRFGVPEELALGVGDHTAVGVSADRERNVAMGLGMAELRSRDVVVGELIGPDERAFIELAVRNIVDLKVFLALIGQRNDVGSALDLNADVGARRESEAVFRAEHSEESLNGALVSFDYYEYCTQQNLDIENAKTVALNFLEKMGMENMTAVKVSQTGATASFTFCYELDGDLFYPDSVNVKVCEEKGVVVGYNASAYLRHHKERTPLKPTVSMTSAKEKLHDKLTLEGSKVALINVKGHERVAYEFICSYNDETYFVYIDGNTGEEISILNAKTIMR